MRRQRYDSDSDDGDDAPQPIPAAVPAVEPVTTAAPTAATTTASSTGACSSSSVFGGGTLFAKGKRTQLASALAERVEEGKLGGDNDAPVGLDIGLGSADGIDLLGGGMGMGVTAPGGISPLLRGRSNSGSVGRPMTLVDQLNESVESGGGGGSALLSHTRAGGAPGSGSHRLRAADLPPMAAGEAEGDLLPINQQQRSQSMEGSLSALPPSAAVLQSSTQQQQQSQAPAAPRRPTVPVGLTTIRPFVTKGLKPQMNCRIDDDERGRSGVWLPPSTIIAMGGASGLAVTAAAAAAAAATAAAAAKKANPSSPTGAKGGKGSGSAANASTLLSVRPIESNRVRTPTGPLAGATAVATTGPIPVSVLRSLKYCPVADSSDSDDNSDAAKRSGGQTTNGGDGGEDSKRGRGGEEGEGARRGGGFHRSEGGRGRGGGAGRWGGRGEANMTHGNSNANNRFADEAPVEIVRHIDAGGGGLQHPYFNTYCDVVLGKVALAVDLAAPPTSGLASPTDPAAGGGTFGVGASGGFPPQPSAATAAAAPTPTLTVLSHSLRTSDVLAMYCGHTAPTTSRQAGPLTSPLPAGADGGATMTTAAASAVGVVGHKTAKPLTFAVADGRGELLPTRSGWRWDGIVRGNPAMLARYAVLD